MNYYDWQLVKDHYYLGTRNGGPSKTLTNNVVVIHILLNDLISNWMFPMHVSEYQTASSLMALNLTLNAKIHNAPLAVQNTYCQATLPLVIDATGSWVTPSFGITPMPALPLRVAMARSPFPTLSSSGRAAMLT